MTKFDDLPSEIWHLIAQYLLTSQLFKLKWLNSFFFNCWMDLTWKRVTVQPAEIVDFDSKFLRRLLDPFVAPRTKHLSIVLDNSPEMRLAGALASLLHSLTLLPNLTSLNIYHATFHLASSFRIIASSSLSRTLQQLVLTGRVEMFASIREYGAHKSLFDNLTTLTLELCEDDDDEDPQLDSSLTLEPFLRSLAATLQSLTIRNKSFTLNLFPLFNALSKPDSPALFPKLTSFSLSLHFNTSLRTSSQSLRHFLCTHNQLQHLHLNMALPLPYLEDDELLGAWLADLSNNVHLPSLQSLDIYPSNTQTGLCGLLGLIEHTVPTLSSLLVGRLLEPGMAYKVIGALTNCKGQPSVLKNLDLNITELSVSFLELIACKLPQLEKLSLSCLQVVGSGQNSFHDLLSTRQYNRDDTSTQDVFHAWKLRDLKVYLNPDWNDEDGDDECVIRAVAGAVPTLAHLRGQDMGDDDELRL